MQPQAGQYHVTFGIAFVGEYPVPSFGYIKEGSETTTSEFRPVSRVGDKVVSQMKPEGTIVSGSTSVITDKQPTARIKDSFAGGYMGVIIEGCTSRVVGD